MTANEHERFSLIDLCPKLTASLGIKWHRLRRRRQLNEGRALPLPVPESFGLKSAQHPSPARFSIATALWCHGTVHRDRLKTGVAGGDFPRNRAVPLSREGAC
jgi:hypothetical protein